MVNIIFSDLDNTLADKRYISEKNISAINKYTSLGNLFVITSGRSVSYINKIAKCISNKRYIIGNNGSIIYDNKDKKVIYSNLIDYKSIIKIYDLCYKKGLKFIISGIEYDYVNKDAYYNQKIIHKLDEKTVKENYVSQIIIDTKNKEDILKIMDEVSKIKNIAIINKSRTLYDNSYRNDNYWINIGSKDVNKGFAVKYLCKYLKINLTETLRVGDDLNDIPMFFKEGINVAPQNGFKLIKEKADYIVPSYKEDSIYYIINNILSNVNKNIK